MMLRQIAAMIAKDLRIELRTREVLYTSLLFSVVLVTLFIFSGFGETADTRRAAPGVLWVSMTFVGTLVFGRTFQRERDERALLGLLLAPGATKSLYWAKLCVNLLFLGSVEVVLVPLVAMLFKLQLCLVLGPLVTLLAAGTLGFCALGTVLAAALSSLRLKEVLMPLVLFPLALPLLLAGVKGTSALIDTPGWQSVQSWLTLIVAFDMLFLVLSAWLFRQALDS
ncbi:MAG: heme exporter protein CcmB [Bradymonadia bacterium]|jgi:heme exporter protein CcmB